MTLQSLATGDHRSDDNTARNAWRHPVETLEFFGLEADTTVIEILPSTGWYTGLLLHVRDQGKYYAAHFSPNAALDYMPRIRGLFEEKISSDPENYGRIRRVTESAARSHYCPTGKCRYGSDLP